MARTKLLQCMIENARLEEKIGESTEPGGHPPLAQDYVRQAIGLAKHTENRRLLAHAYVWRGLTYSNRFIDDSVWRETGMTRPSRIRKACMPRAHGTICKP